MCIRDRVYSSFSIIGGTHFDGWYWSSTEDGAGKDTPKVFALISSLTKDVYKRQALYLSFVKRTKLILILLNISFY